MGIPFFCITDPAWEYLFYFCKLNIVFLRYEYKMAREYNWNVKNKATKGYEVKTKGFESLLRCLIDIIVLLFYVLLSVAVSVRIT